jgi:thymidylate synthase
MNGESNYLDIIRNILANGKYKENRTGVGAYTIAHTMIQHDMSLGFPLLTTKKMGVRSISAELEGFIKGITDKQWFIDRKCNIWNEWCNPKKVPSGLSDSERKAWQLDEMDLGPIYGFNWRNFNGWYKPKPSINLNLNKDIIVDLTNNKSGIVGEKYTSNNYGTFIVVREYYNGKQQRFDVKFEKTGYVGTNLTKQNITKTGDVCDPYYPSVYGVAATGIVDLKNKLNRKLRTTWEEMISRCYNTDDVSYKTYGDKGVYVDDRWLILENFIEDVKSLINWDRKTSKWAEYTLDKDYHQMGYYSKDTCIWLSKKDQALYSERFGSNTNKNLYKNGYDQVKQVVDNLKNDPNNRRMLVSGWNPNQLNEMALPPCHVLHHLTVVGDTLNLCWFQRSVDVGLGLPYNLASYALLLHLYCKESGYKEGTVTGFLSDVHIYENHVEALKEQILREQYELPTINTEQFTSIFDWEYTDTKLSGYTSHPTIKMDVAV